MDEPTQWELIRSIQSGMLRMEQNQHLYVTQEQRLSDKEIAALKHEALMKDQGEDRARIAALEDDKLQMRRLILSAFLLPLLVALGLWALGVMT